MIIKFIFLVFIFLSTSVVIFSQESENYGLVLSGEVNDVEIVENKFRENVAVTATATLKIVNNNQHTVILVNPKFYTYGLISFATTLQESIDDDVYRSNRYVSSSSIPKEVEILANKLDSKKPPKEFVIILQSGQSFIWKDDIFASFKNTQQTAFDYGTEWRTLRENGNEFWITFTYSLPWGINYYKPNLLDKLPKRWKKYGVFPISCSSDDNCEKKDFKIKTEPIFIDFSKAKMKQSS